MEAKTIGTRIFKITIPGKQPERFQGTEEEAWHHISRNMVGVAPGLIPGIEEEKQQEPAVKLAPSVAAPVSHSEAMSRGVNTEDAARSTVDLLAAQAAGFAPARPYFDRGTPVIGMGVENARKSAREHEAKPRVEESLEGFLEHIREENRRDEEVAVSSLVMRADGSLTGPGDIAWQVEPQALAQLGARLGMAQPSYLAGVWPTLRASNWNQHIAAATQHDKNTCPKDHPAFARLVEANGKTVKARLRDTTEGGTALWAVVGANYANYDVDKIATALKLAMGAYPEARCEVKYNGFGATIDVMFHADTQPERYVAGEFFKAGLRIRTSDAAGGSIVVSLLLWQNLCLNLLCIDVATFALDRIQHKGSIEAMALRFKAAVSAGESKLGHFLEQWGYATDEPLLEVTSNGVKPANLRILDEMVTEEISELELLTGVFKGLGKSMSIGKNDLPGLMAAHAQDHSGAVQVAPVTRASVVNAITRYAHQNVGRVNPTRQHELEREAGALLVGSRGGKPAPLPFLPPAPTREKVRVPA